MAMTPAEALKARVVAEIDAKADALNAFPGVGAVRIVAHFSQADMPVKVALDIQGR